MIAKLLTTTEAAQRCGFSAAKVRSLIEAGKLPAVDTSAGGKYPRWSIREDDLSEFLQSRSHADVPRRSDTHTGAARRQRLDAGLLQVY